MMSILSVDLIHQHTEKPKKYEPTITVCVQRDLA